MRLEPTGISASLNAEGYGIQIPVRLRCDIINSLVSWKEAWCFPFNAIIFKVMGFGY